VTIPRSAAALTFAIAGMLSLPSAALALPPARGLTVVETSEPTPATPSAVSPAGGPTISLVIGGLTQPVFVTHAGDDRLFVVERTGRIRIVKKVSGQWRITGTFLNLTGKVESGYSEQGLLGLAFHPHYATNGRFYVDYINLSGDSVIAEYRRATANKADPSSRRQVLKVHQPYDNHNGGWIGFKGNYLYIAFGDGGSGGDPGHRGQDLGTLLAKILRIDPIDPDGAGPKHYRVPSDNPFVGRSGRDEIWAYGFRNPWRDSFDRLTGDLWAADVGQETYEEVDHAGGGKGKNFGWSLLEGRHRYPSGALCTSNCKTLPVVEYRHSVSGADNCSVTGGYVARRPGAALFGRYFFGDYCSGRLWSIPESFSGGALPTPLDTGLSISSFGEGNDGRIYVLSLGGTMYRVNGT
jgi:glucose/arabinose dehydrogenase